MNKEDYKRQLIIANSLYELGLDVDLIKQITTVNSNDLDLYRLKNQKTRIMLTRKTIKVYNYTAK